MKTKLFTSLIIIASVFCIQSAHAQGWEWAKDASGTGVSDGKNVVTDRSGNVYVTGVYTGAITFGTTTLTYDSSRYAHWGMFLVKYDSLGNVLWARGAGVLNAESSLLAIDAAGNIYITGEYDSIISFGTIALSTCGGGGAMFIVKYNSAGNVIWAKTSNCYIGLDENLGPVSLEADSLCNIYITGYYRDNILTFGSITLAMGSNYGSVFLVKFDSSGNAAWGRGEGGGSGFGNQVNCLSVDKFNNIYITGYYSDTITFGIVHLSFAGQAMFLVKYDALGNVIYAKSIASMLSNGQVVTTDLWGNVFVSGQYYNSITFGTTTLTTSSQALFLVKYDSSGNTIWAKGTSGLISGDELLSIAIDLSDNVYLTGSFNGIFTFGSSTLSTSSSCNMFLVKYDSTGNVIWTNVGTGSSTSRGVSVASDIYSNIYLTGNFTYPSLTFGYTYLTTSNTSGTLFVAKFNERTLGVNNVIMSKCANVLIYPNPANNAINLMFDNATSVSSISIFDVLGRRVLDCPIENRATQSVPISLPLLKDGVYFLKVTDNNISERIPFIIKN